MRLGKRAVSPLIATMMLIGVVLAAGFAVWSFANSATGAALSARGTEVARNVNQLNEKFIIFNANFSASKVRLWFYNNGNLTTQITAIVVWNAASPGTKTSLALPASTQLAVGVVTTLTVPALDTYTFTAGQTYYFQAVGQFGNTYTYFQQA